MYNVRPSGPYPVCAYQEFQSTALPQVPTEDALRPAHAATAGGQLQAQSHEREKQRCSDTHSKGKYVI